MKTLTLRGVAIFLLVPIGVLGLYLSPLHTQTAQAQSSGNLSAAPVDVYLQTTRDPAAVGGDGSATAPYTILPDTFDAKMLSLLSIRSQTYVLKGQLPNTKIVFHLKNGTYLTAGFSNSNGCGTSNGCPIQWSLPSNASIVGESRDGTIIRLSDSFFVDSNKTRLADIMVIRGDGFKWAGSTKAVPDAEGLSNLTIDGNYKNLVEKFNTAPYGTPQNNTRIHGVQIYGQGNFIDTVRLRDIGVYDSGNEAFGFLLQLSEPNVADPTVRYNLSCSGSPSDVACSRIINSVYEESALHPTLKKRGLVTLFNITGSWNTPTDPTNVARQDVFMNGSVIANNRISFSNTDGEQSLFQGYSVHHTYGGKVIGNIAENIAAGYYSDWWQDYNLEIANNHFLGASRGIDIKTDALPNFKKIGYNIHDNEITIIPIYDGARAGIRIHRNLFTSADTAYYPPSPYVRELKNFRVANNTIRFATAPTGPFENSAILIVEVQGLEISNNVFDSRFYATTNQHESKYRYFYMPQMLSGTTYYRDTGVTISGNTDSTGSNIDCLVPTDEIDFANPTAQAAACSATGTGTSAGSGTTGSTGSTGSGTGTTPSSGTQTFASSAVLSGFGWSSTVGWLSFSSANDTPPGGSYSVTRDMDGTLHGYVWSPNIGWIKFGGLSVSEMPSPTAAPGTQQINAAADPVSGRLIGWARACAGAGNPLTCSDAGTPTYSADSPDPRGGWGGWISLGGTAPSGTYGAQLNPSTGMYTGFLWGGDVLGWISLSYTAPSGGGGGGGGGGGCVGVCESFATPLGLTCNIPTKSSSGSWSWSSSITSTVQGTSPYTFTWTAPVTGTVATHSGVTAISDSYSVSSATAGQFPTVIVEDSANPKARSQTISCPAVPPDSLAANLEFGAVSIPGVSSSAPIDPSLYKSAVTTQKGRAAVLRYSIGGGNANDFYYITQTGPSGSGVSGYAVGQQTYSSAFTGQTQKVGPFSTLGTYVYTIKVFSKGVDPLTGTPKSSSTVVITVKNNPDLNEF